MVNLTLRRVVNPDRLLLKKYHLTTSERLQMIVWIALLSQVAEAIGSSGYFLSTQVGYQAKYGTTTVTLFYLKDTWDRLPIHVQNLFHAHWFGVTQQAPLWWITARHDARHVLIGFVAATLIGSITIGLKRRKRASTRRMLLSVPTALVVAIAVAAILILLFAYVTPFVNHFGVTTGNPFLRDLIGKGTIQLTIIGFAAGFASKACQKRTFDTIQLMSLERNISQGDSERWWWKFVYPPNYRNRFRLLVAEKHESQVHSRWLGLVLTLGAPFMLFLFVFGIYLTYWGPASHAS
jgi:hypothetical protein